MPDPAKSIRYKPLTFHRPSSVLTLREGIYGTQKSRG
jgi:hypothetical protein